ncbi:MAG: LicD family protein [Elusimicrobiaceae bacterium]|nr:LicD family protein [Elusimicrobiaceae bacterium]
MYKIIIQILAAFIPNEAKRARFRDKYLNKKVGSKKFIFSKETKLTRLANLENKISVISYFMEKCPKATGFLRAVQLINLDILCEIDRICRKHHLSYWLDWGTLLGALRHKGFIPWDDDLDISMPAGDFEKFKKIALTEFDSNFQLKQIPANIGKIVHKDFSPETEKEWLDFINWNKNQKHLFFATDIFIYHFLKEEIPSDIAKEKLSEIMYEKAAAYKCTEYSFKGWEKVDKIVQKQNVIASKTQTDKLFLGAECFTPNKEGRIFKKDEIFPLREIEFEGKKFFAPNKTELLLFRNFGNFYKYEITHSHLDFNLLTEVNVENLLKRLHEERK